MDYNKIFIDALLITGAATWLLFVLWCFGAAYIEIILPGSTKIASKEYIKIVESHLAGAVAKQVYVYYEKAIGPIFLQGDVADQNSCDLVTASDIRIWLKGALKTKYVGIEVEEPVEVKQDVDKR